MSSLLSDLRYALRRLSRSAGFVATTVFLLSLGVGGSAVVMGVTYGAQFAPLPYAEPRRLVRLFEFMNRTCSPGCLDAVTLEAFRAWKEQSQSFQSLEASSFSRLSTEISDSETHVVAAKISPGLFRMLAVQPLLGRVFNRDEYQGQGAPTAVISNELWRRAFAASHAVLGRTLRLDGVSYTVIGVMPAAFQYPSWAQLWLPWDPEWGQAAPSARVDVVARLRDGVSVVQARADLALLARRDSVGMSDMNKGRVGTAISMQQVVRGQGSSVWIMLAAVLGALLVVCANVASLFLVRALGRQHELAVRAALGASDWRLAKSLILEAVIIAVVSGAVGLALAVLGSNALSGLLERYLQLQLSIPLDLGLLGPACALLSLLSVSVGLAPVLHLRALDLREALQESGHSSSQSVRQGRIRKGLLVLQTAGSVVLTLAAGALALSFARINRFDVGYDTSNLYEGEIVPSAYRPLSPLEFSPVAERVEGALTRAPGIQSVAVWATSTPRKSFRPFAEQMSLEDRRPNLSMAAVPPYSYAVSAEFFQTFRIRLVRGRLFRLQEDSHAPPVAIVNEEAARLWWPGENAVGKRFRLGASATEPWLTVVGVVANTHTFNRAGVFGAIENPGYFPLVFRPLSQVSASDLSVAVRTSAADQNPERLISTRVAALGAGFRLSDFANLRKELSEFGPFLMTQVTARMAGAFALFTLVLMLTGVYAMVADAVTQRRSEIGIRLALGSPRGRVISLVMDESLRLSLLGIVVGVCGFLFANRFLRGMLFLADPLEPRLLGGVACAVLGIVLVSAWLAARRILRMDPQSILRQA